ncbi:MAG: hypothetical protein ABXS91_01475 [Sulfurimonas sp.]
MLEKLYTDDAYIVDKEGNMRGPYKTRFGSGNTLTFLDETLEIVVDTGYEIIRPLDNGEEMVFTVTAYEFQERINRIPPQHIVKIENRDKPKEETETVQKKVVRSTASQMEETGVMNIPDAFVELIEGIDTSDTTPEEKAEARSMMKELLENRSVSAILGEATSGLLLLLD